MPRELRRSGGRAGWETGEFERVGGRKERGKKRGGGMRGEGKGGRCTVTRERKQQILHGWLSWACVAPVIRDWCCTDLCDLLP